MHMWHYMGFGVYTKFMDLFFFNLSLNTRSKKPLRHVEVQKEWENDNYLEERWRWTLHLNFWRLYWRGKTVCGREFQRVEVRGKKLCWTEDFWTLCTNGITDATLYTIKKITRVSRSTTPYMTTVLNIGSDSRFI